MIFINKYLYESQNKEKTIKKSPAIRGSKYRGISKNGNKWQTIVTFKKINEYVGVFETEEIAARIYDIVSIKNRGIKAKTNFKYDISQIQKIIEAKIDYKSKNISEIISKLIGK